MGDRPNLAASPVAGSPADDEASDASVRGSGPPLSGVASPELSCRDSLSMPNFGPLGGGMERMLRLGKAQRDDTDNMECTVLGGEMSMLRGQSPRAAPAAAAASGQRPDQPRAPEQKVERKPRCPATDNVSADDAYGVVAAALCTAVRELGPTCPTDPAALRKKAGDICGALTGGKKGTALPEIKKAAQAAARELAAGGDGAQQGAANGGAPEQCPVAVLACEQGGRPYMEDFGAVFCPRFSPQTLFARPGAAVQADKGHSYIAVFDGHGGCEAAEWSCWRLQQGLFAHPSYTSCIEDALRDAFREVDERFNKFANEHDIDSGACALVALHRPDSRDVVTAWLGDCAAFICRGEDEDDFECIKLSTSHTLQNKAEEEAVVARGGRLLFGGGRLRVEGALQITRSLGDRKFRSALNQAPEVKVTPLEDGDEFLLVATDGLTEPLKPEDACEFVRQSKMILDELYEQQRQLLRAWEAAGRPARLAAPPAGAAVLSTSPTLPKHPGDGSDGSPGSGGSAGGEGKRRWSAGWGDDGEEGATDLPVFSQEAYDAIRKLAETQETIREGLETLEGDPQPALLDELLETAFLSPEAVKCASYQVIVDALIAEAFSQKRSGRDNIYIVLLFFAPKHLSRADAALARQIREGSALR